MLIQIYDDGWRLHVQGQGLKGADLPASLRNQIQNESNTNPTGKAVCWTAVTVALWGI